MLYILDYGVGNLNSIYNMLRRAGVEAIITDNSADIPKASKLLLPGMGHFDNCMLRFNQSGMREKVETAVIANKTPVLGICVGLQMFMERSEEGKEPGLGWVKGDTIRFKNEMMKEALKIPNMGWLEVQQKKATQLLSALQESRFYFAHSYHVLPENGDDAAVVAHYGYDFVAGIEKENIVGVQFHPEKSHRFGMQLLKNFSSQF